MEKKDKAVSSGYISGIRDLGKWYARQKGCVIPDEFEYFFDFEGLADYLLLENKARYDMQKGAYHMSMGATDTDINTVENEYS